MRDKNVHNAVTGSMWASSLLFSLVQELASLWSPETTSMDGRSHLLDALVRTCVQSHSLAEAVASSRVHVYNKLAARIEELGLPAAVDAKPVLDVSSFPSPPS